MPTSRPQPGHRSGGSQVASNQASLPHLTLEDNRFFFCSGISHFPVTRSARREPGADLRGLTGSARQAGILGLTGSAGKGQSQPFADPGSPSSIRPPTASAWRGPTAALRRSSEERSRWSVSRSVLQQSFEQRHEAILPHQTCFETSRDFRKHSPKAVLAAVVS